MGLLQDEQIIWNTNIMFLAILVWLGYNYLDFVIVIVGLNRLLWIFAWFLRVWAPKIIYKNAA